MSQFAVIPTRAYDDPRMDAHLRDVLGLLATYADRDGWCWPSQETLAKRLKLSRTTVNGYLRKLSKLGYITSKRKQNGCLYRILYDHQMSARPTSDVGSLSTSDVDSSPTQNTPNEHYSPPRKAHRIPENWQPSAESLLWAAENYPNVDLARETERMRYHFLDASGKGAARLSWDPTWRNWIIRAAPEYDNVRHLPPRDARRRGRETDEERRDKLVRAALSQGAGDDLF